MQVAALFGDQRLDRRRRGAAFEQPRLRVEALQRGKFFVAAELGLGDRRLQHGDRLVVDLDRHRERMAVFAAVGERMAGRIAEAARRAVQHLGDQRERPHRARADAGNLQEVLEVARPRFGRRGQRAG